MANQEIWHKHWMKLALLTAELSKDPTTKVGAVIVSKNNKQCSVGYNGPMSGFDDTEEDWLNREIKHEMVIHAEENAILNCPFPKEGCRIYVTFKPCHKCLIRVGQAGIKEVYWRTDYTKMGYKNLWDRAAKKFDVITQLPD